MNLNDFVVLPTSKAKSVKLNARNLQELQMETVSLAQESEEMEGKLQQLKESMSKEKEERGHSGAFRWKSGQSGSLNSNARANGTKKNKENTLQKLSAGKVKIRVLKDEPLTTSTRPVPPAPAAAVAPPTARRNRLQGTHCGQCEVNTAGLRCAECSENYCVGCFTKFHQKGALKLHRMIPIETNLQTHVSTRDVVNCFQKQNNNNGPGTFTDLRPSPRSKPNPDHSKVALAAAVDHGEWMESEMIAEGPQRQDGTRTFLLGGEYDEEESAKSFQEALRQWRGETSDAAAAVVQEEEPLSQAAMWTPVSPVPVSSTATQADLAAADGGDEDGGRGRGGGRGGGDRRLPVKVEFHEDNLSYMDRLLLKKHRRTPVDIHRPLSALGSDFKSPPHIDSQGETANSLTAEEEDFRLYCASLFAVPVPVPAPGPGPQISAPESCLVIEVLDEDHRAAEGASDKKRKFFSVQQVFDKGRAALTSSESSRISSSSSPSPIQPSVAPSKVKTAHRLPISKPQTSQAECRTPRASSSRSQPSSTRPADEAPRTSDTSIRTPPSPMSRQQPNGSPAVPKSGRDRDSPRLLSSSLSLPRSQSEISKSSFFSPDVSLLASCELPLPPRDRLSASPSAPFSLRSTFDVSPSSSTESSLLPKVCRSIPSRVGSDLSLSPGGQPQSPKLSPKPLSSMELPRSPASNLGSERPSPHPLCDSLVSDKQLQQPPSPSYSLSLSNEYPQRAYSGIRSTNATEEDPQVFMSLTPVTGDCESTLSHQNTHCAPTHPLNVSHDLPFAPEMEEEEELSIDECSGDEMSSDSLGLAPHEEDSSDEEEEEEEEEEVEEEEEEEEEEEQISTIGRTREEEERDHLQSDEQEQLSEASLVTHHKQEGAGSGSESACDPGRVPPPGSHVNFGHSGTREHKHSSDSPCKSHTTFLPDSDQTGSGTDLSYESTPSPLSRPLSKAVRGIREVCDMDGTGCEDPDLDTDATAHAIQGLEQELRLMAEEETAARQASVFSAGISGSLDQDACHFITRGRAREEQRDEEAAAHGDRLSVLSLP